MPEFSLVKTSKETFVGLTQADQEKFQKHLKWRDSLEPGEFFKVKVTRQRNPKFLAKFMVMLHLAFDHWEPALGRKRLKYKGVPIEKDFEQFREDITIQAGFYIAKYDARGRVHLKAKSISFDEMETDEQFEKVYRAVQQVLLERVLHNYTRENLDEVVEKLQRFGSNNG